MTLKRPKATGGKKKKLIPAPAIYHHRNNDSDWNGEDDNKVNLIFIIRRFQVRFRFIQQS